MYGSVLEGKSSFKILGLTFSSKLDWGSYMISIAKTASKKIGALVRSMKFLSPEVAYLQYSNTAMHSKLLTCLGWHSSMTPLPRVMEGIEGIEVYIGGN